MHLSSEYFINITIADYIKLYGTRDGIVFIYNSAKKRFMETFAILQLLIKTPAMTMRCA